MASDGSSSVLAVFEAISSIAVPVAEKKFLRRRAVEVAAASGAAATATSDGVLAAYEQLATTADMGMAKLTRDLRAGGHQGLARRVARLQQGRRALAHPDVRLAAEVREALCNGGDERQVGPERERKPWAGLLEESSDDASQAKPESDEVVAGVPFAEFGGTCQQVLFDLYVAKDELLLNRLTVLEAKVAGLCARFPQGAGEVSV